MAFLNKAIRSFGEDFVLKYIKTFYETYKAPLVSVGSGLGQIEWMALGRNSRMTIICVDPEPQSYHVNSSDVKPFMTPDYSYVDDLCVTRPNIIGNCVLFLNWCDPNDSSYDMEAVEQLKPIAILAIIESFGGSNGAAGGEKFHNWLRSENNGYKEVHFSSLSPMEGEDDCLNISIEWLQKEGLEEIEVGLPIIVHSHIKHEQVCCIS
jgi:hypothetical protein